MDSSLAAPPRSDAVDLLRGLAIALMGLDHALAALDPGHFVTDSPALWTSGAELPAVPFLLRWVSHFCAPVFVLLAGAGLALARARHGAHATQRGAERAVFLMLLDPLALSWVWARIEPLPRPWLFQVIFAIGAAMALGLLALRWLPSRLRTGLAVSYLLAQDLVIYAVLRGDLDSPPEGAIAFLFTGGIGAQYFVVYPVLPWCAVLLLGVQLGEWLSSSEPGPKVERKVARAGLAVLALFLLVRSANGYGNLGLYRDDLSPLQWLHCAKYPPALSYLAMTLGPALLLLAALLRREREGHGMPRGLAPLVTLGRAALVFYLAHLVLLAALRAALPESWRGTWLAVGVALALPFVLLPLAQAFLRARRRYPRSWLRLL
ncbi:MAG: DUF1624 domain-containing protein [Planctomycetes bacterium]|nr:DUF1624 domain-containing protein [Planctomycetota bacterium]